MHQPSSSMSSDRNHRLVPSSRPPSFNIGTSSANSSIGPCYLKLLVSNIVAGSIIGQKGATISSISSKTGCTIRLSHSSCYFPGTVERVVAMWGTLEQVKAAFLVVLEKIRDAPSTAADGAQESSSTSKMISKIVVPNSAVSQLIGKQGQTIKQLQETTGTKIQISNRDEHYFKERIVIITGSFDSVCKASFDVMEAIQSDPHIKDHTEINYLVSVPIVLPQSFPGGSPMIDMSHHSQCSNDMMRNMAQMNQTAGYLPFPQQGLNPSGIRMIPAMQSGTVTAHSDIPDNFVGFTIGKQGSTLQVIQQQSGAKLQVSGKGEYVPGTSNRRVTITGAPHSVQIAQMLLQQKVREIEEMTAQKEGRLFMGRSAVEQERLPTLSSMNNGSLGQPHHMHGGMQPGFPSQGPQPVFPQFSSSR